MGEEEGLRQVERLLSRLEPDRRAEAAVAALGPPAAAGVELDAYGDDVREYLRQSAAGESRPALEAAARWLARRMATGERAVCRDAVGAELQRMVAGRAVALPLLAGAVAVAVGAAPPADGAADPVWMGLARAVVGEVTGLAREA